MHQGLGENLVNRISLTYLSQMTPSHAPLTGDEFWRGDQMGALGLAASQNLMLP